MAHYVMDYETMSTCFIACFEHYKTDETKIFVVHKLRNNFPEFIHFLEQNKLNNEWHISFNGLAFDAQITEHILRNKNKLLTLSVESVINYIYNYAQEIIRRTGKGEWLDYPEWKLGITQIDVYKLNHWDNANKRTSLKWAEYSMDMENIQEMPIHHSTPITTQEEIDTVIGYCLNDVKATKKIMYLSKPLLDVRTRIKNKYGIKCYSYSNTKLGSELLLELYCNMVGKDPREVKQYRTRRHEIHIKEVLFSYIKFQTPELQGFLEMLKTKVITDTKKGFKYSLDFRGYTFDYGLGGIHQCIQTGIYTADNDFIIKDLDVASLYPSIACMNGMSPAHLGKEFFEVYKNNIVDVRLAEKAKPKAERDVAIIEGFKEAANSSYGNSNSEYSWLYDPFYTMQTTVNGQLLLTMLVENLLLNIPEAQLLQTNTDGATLRFNKKYLSVYENICKEWEKITKLTLEFADYKAMYIWDVNNYFSIKTDGTPKCKGRFEWEDLEKHKYTHLHKNKSHLIIAKAVFNYFVNNIPPEVYLQNNRNIYDYCAGIKGKGDWEFHQTCVVKGEVQTKILPKIVRYYISESGCKIIKINKKDKRDIQTESGKWMQTEFNQYVKKEWSEYGVDDSYYLERIYQEIDNIVPKPTIQYKLEL